MMCQFPFEQHEYEDIVSTKPRVFCKAHVKGWTCEPQVECSLHHDQPSKHGDTRRVEKASDGSYRLVREVALSDAEVNHWLYAKEQRLTPLQRLFSPLYHWKELKEERIDQPGVSVRVHALVLGKNGRPRWDPGLFRRVKHLWNETILPVGFSLDKVKYIDEDGFAVTMGDGLDEDGGILGNPPAEPAPPLAELPSDKSPLVTEGTRRGLSGLIRYIRAALTGDMEHAIESSFLDGAARELLEAQASTLLLQLHAQLIASGETPPDALLGALLRVNPVQDIEDSTSRHIAKERTK